MPRAHELALCRHAATNYCPQTITAQAAPALGGARSEAHKSATVVSYQQLIAPINDKPVRSEKWAHRVSSGGTIFMCPRYRCILYTER